MKIRVNPWLDFLGALGAGAIVTAFCLVLLGHDPLLFWNDDYEVSILPVFADVARSWSEGHWPLLSPYSWACSNLAGEFQYGTFSVFVNAAVVLIWKFPLSFSQQAAALSVTHLFVLAMGGYLLARGRNLSPPLSIMVALVSALNGWIICWGATDWFGALGAFAWFPWAWWGLERALDSRRSHWRFLWPAPFVYLLVTGGFPYTVLMLALLAGWLCLKFTTANSSFGGSLGRTKSFFSVWTLILGLALGFGLSAPAWLALFDYLRGSAREVQDSASHFQWLVPASALPAFILPNWTVNWTDFSTRLVPHTATEMACGLVPPVALLAGLITCGGILLRRIKWELGLLVAVLIISMLPSASVFRWSFRWLPFLHVILALCAADALRALFEREPGAGQRRIIVSPGVMALVLVTLTAGAMRLFRLEGVSAWPFEAIVIALAIVWAGLDFFRFERVQAWAAPVFTGGVLLATYLCLPSNCGVPKYNLDPRLIEPAPLDPERLYLSVYPAPEFAYRLEDKPQPFGTTLRIGSTSMWGGIHLLNGYSPVRPSGVAREFDLAIHGEIPPEVGQLLLENEGGPDGKLARLGVDGIIVANEFAWAPQPDTEWELTVATEEGRVFHRRGGALDRMRSVTSIDSRPNEQFARADVSRIINGRNRLQADVTVPPNGPSALLTISRPFFSGYHATIENRPLKVEAYRSLMPIVEIPPGTTGRLILAYRPWWLVYGGTLSLGCFALILAASVQAWRSRSRESG